MTIPEFRQWLESAIQQVLPPAASIGILAWLKFLPQLHLRPLANWPGPLDWLTFISAVIGLLVAYNTFNRRPLLAIVVSSIFLVVFYFVYGWFAQNPPESQNMLVYDLGALFFYHSTYFLYGYCTAKIFRLLVSPFGGRNRTSH
jgi:hypothetical protein